MRRILTMMLAAIILFTSCAQAQDKKETTKMDKRVLVVYFSHSNGNTKNIAEQLREALGADIARIEPVKPYLPFTHAYCEMTEQCNDEVQRGYCPELKPLDKDVKDYDVIAVGTPTWWFTLASPVRTFLRDNDLSGKTVIPFMTHGGYPGHVIKDIKRLCPGSTFAPSIEVEFDKEGGPVLLTRQQDITRWIEAVKRVL